MHSQPTDCKLDNWFTYQWPAYELVKFQSVHSMCLTGVHGLFSDQSLLPVW